MADHGRADQPVGCPAQRRELDSRLLPTTRLVEHGSVGGGKRLIAAEHEIVRKTARELDGLRSEEHTSELQSLMRISYAVFCLKKKKNQHVKNNNTIRTAV